MELTSVDIILLCVFFGSGIWGMAAGATKLFAPFTLLFALAAVFRAYPNFSAHLGKAFFSQFLLGIFLILLGLLLAGLIGRALYTALHTIGLGHIDRLIGLPLGLATGCVGAGLFMWLLGTYAEPQANVLLQESVLAPSVLEFFEMVMTLAEKSLASSEAETAVVENVMVTSSIGGSLFHQGREAVDVQGSARYVRDRLDYNHLTRSLEIVATCSLRCPGCWVGMARPDMWTAGAGEAMPPALFDAALGFGRELGVSRLTLLGGEPTLHPLLPVMIILCAD